jgi:transcriptional regulator with XRE-family HTH domain
MPLDGGANWVRSRVGQRGLMVTGRRGASPTVRRRRLGAELRRYRETAGLTIDHVADRLDCSASKISRLETGQTGSSPRDVRDMLTLYQVGEPELEDLMEVARETRQRGWWQPYGSVLTGAYIGFEAAAQTIRSYEAQCIPGLLQTEEYARSLINAASYQHVAPDETDNRVRVRLARQELLTQDEPVDFWCVLDEAALRRLVGGREVMQRQLNHLICTVARPNVTVQVLRLDVGAHPGMEGSFVLLAFPDEADTDTVYVTMATGGVFQEKVDELSRYSMIFDRLRDLALPPDESTELMAQLVKEL